MRRPAIAAVMLLAPMVLGIGIPEDQFACEEAAARLDECCDEFDPKQVSCEVTGCGTTVVEMKQGDRNCLANRTCEEIRAQGICERAQQLAASSTDAGVLCP